jgi:hypothetical protein
MELKEICLGGVDWIRLAQNRGPAVGCCECGYELWGSCATELVTLSFWLQKPTEALPERLITTTQGLSDHPVFYNLEFYYDLRFKSVVYKC